MFCLLLLVLLCQISTYSGFPQWLQTRVEVTVMSRYTYLNDWEVQALFNDYGKRHGVSSNDVPHRTKNCNGPDKSPARFEAYVTNCNDFQTYLLYFGNWLSKEYNFKMIHVRCNALHFALCLTTICPQKDFIALGNCAYNTTY